MINWTLVDSFLIVNTQLNDLQTIYLANAKVNFILTINNRFRLAFLC